MKRALQLDSSGGGLPAARCSPDRIEHLSPPVKRAKLAGSGSPGVAAIVVSVQSTNAVSSASSVPPVAVRQCPSNVLPPSLVSGDIVTWLSSRMCSVVRMVSIGWKAFVGSRYDAGPNAADEFCIYRFSPRLLIFAPARNAGAYRKQDMHVYIRCPLRTRLVGGHLRFYRHGTYQTPGDPANYRARVYGSVVGNAFVQSSTKQRVIVDF